MAAQFWMNLSIQNYCETNSDRKNCEAKEEALII